MPLETFQLYYRPDPQSPRQHDGFAPAGRAGKIDTDQGRGGCRGEEHDQSKMESPEVEAFAKAPCLDEIKYDSPEYKKSKADLGEALEHHYANNRHHIPHHKNGIRDMNLIDVVEMFCDWKASSERM